MLFARNLPRRFVGFGDSFVSQRLVSFVSTHTKEWSKWQASENAGKTVIYAHAFDKTKREAQEKLGKVMGL